MHGVISTVCSMHQGMPCKMCLGDYANHGYSIAFKAIYFTSNSNFTLISHSRPLVDICFVFMPPLKTYTDNWICHRLPPKFKQEQRTCCRIVYMSLDKALTQTLEENSVYMMLDRTSIYALLDGTSVFMLMGILFEHHTSKVHFMFQWL